MTQRTRRAVRVVWAFLCRDVRHSLSYRTAFAGQILGVGLSLLSVVFLARIVPGNQRPLAVYGSDYFTFVLLGTGAATFFQTGLGAFGEGVGREQSLGTLEALLVTPNDSRLLLLAGAAWPVVFSGITLAAYLIVGTVVFGAHLPPDRLPLFCGVLAASLAAFAALGVLAAAVLVQTKRGSMVVTLLTASFVLLGGVMYPVSVLPWALELLSRVLPITYALDGARRSLVTPLDGGHVLGDVAALLGFTAVVLPVALLAVGWSIDKARHLGTLVQY